MAANSYLEGYVGIGIEWDGHHIRKAEVSSLRPSVANHLLSGRSLDEAPILLARLFTLCGTSQEAAARLACQTAGGKDQRALGDAEWGVITEVLREHLWRVLVDWPQRLGLTPDIGNLQLFLRALPFPQETAGLDAIMHFSKQVDLLVFGEPAAGWLEHGSLRYWQEWAERRHTSAARLMSEVWQEAAEIAFDSPLLPHPFDAASILALTEQIRTDPGFCKQPRWHGQAVETGSLARMAHHPALTPMVSSGLLLARMLSRLAEIPVLIQRLIDLANGGSETGIAQGMVLSEQEGCAWVETSRGLLVHRVQSDEGRIAQYQIVAPTEWNFHPDGPCRRALGAIRANSEQALRRCIALVVAALDPCVQYQVEIRHA